MELRVIDKTGSEITIQGYECSVTLYGKTTNTDGHKDEVDIQIFIDPQSTAEKPSNYLFERYQYIDPLKLPVAKLTTNAPVDYIIKLQKELDLELGYCARYASHDYPVFNPIKSSTLVDISTTAKVQPPAYGGGSKENFTFEYLKSMFKSLGMSGYSSKSKEQLLDELLEKVTEIAQNTPLTRGACLARTVTRYQGHDWSHTSVVTDVNEAIAINSRIMGGNLFVPKMGPSPDARTLEHSIMLYELVDPYDGLNEFLAEQKDLEPKRKK